MKKEIHPAYTTNTVVTCACGNSFTVGSTKNELRVELCNACHPFYTGKAKFVDTAGRVDKFNKVMSKVSGAAASRKGKKAKDTVRKVKKAEKNKGK